MKTENSLWLFSISITHNSKIRELSDGNRVMEIELLFGQTTFLLWVLPFLSYELWKLRIELSNLIGQTASNISIHFPPPKASHNLSLKKKSCNQSISQPKIIRAPPSPLQVGKISNPTILARVSGEFSYASSTPLRASYVR